MLDRRNRPSSPRVESMDVVYDGLVDQQRVVRT
jgi:hypothetical protein